MTPCIKGLHSHIFLSNGLFDFSWFDSLREQSSLFFTLFNSKIAKSIYPLSHFLIGHLQSQLFSFGSSNLILNNSSETNLTITILVGVWNVTTFCSGSFRHPAPPHLFCYPVAGARWRDCTETNAIRRIVVSMELQWRFFTVTGVLLCTQGETLQHNMLCVVYGKIFGAFLFWVLFLFQFLF